MKFTITYNGKSETFEKKVKLIELTNDDKNIICANVNGRIRELDYDVYYDANVTFLTLADHDAMGIYEKGIRFLFVMASHLVYPGIKFKMTYSVSRSIFAQLISDDGKRSLFVTPSMVQKIEEKMREIVKADHKFERLIKTNEEASKIYQEFNLPDKNSILEYRPEKTVHFYNCNGYFNYMYGRMVPSTGYLKNFKLRFYAPGILIQYPRSEYDGKIPPFKDEPTFSDTLINAQKWSSLVKLSTVSEINKKIKDNELSIVELINLCENKHNRMLCELGQKIEDQIDTIRLICIAGPSSSGKTTFADRLTMELKSRGINPIRVSIDDYYKRREDVPLDDDGNYDFESIEALDVDLFNEDILNLLNGQEVHLPTFSFKENKRTFDRKVILGPKDPIIIEGIHALNEKMTISIPNYLKFKIYISPQAQINLDNENPISLTDIRLLRRIVRDNQYRGSSAIETLSMWPSVRKGEFKWIYATQEYANYVFDSFLSYELCVLSKHALPLLRKIDPESEYGPDAERLISLIKYFKPIDEKWIPCSSILKEFIGGSCYRDAK